MENENNDVDVSNNEELDLDLETPAEEVPLEKPKETPEAKLARLKRQTAQLEKKLGLEEKPESKSKSGDLDYGQKAFLKSYGVAGSDELQLVREYLSNGKSLDDLPNNKYFQNDLSELRDARLVRQAVPSGTARANNNPRDSVEYWIAKGEMPPADQTQLARDVLNARIKRETSNAKFTDNPIVQT